MRIHINKDFYIKAAFFFMVVSESTALTALRIHSFIEYMGLGLFVLALFINREKKLDIFIKKIVLFIIFFTGLGMGILLQNMRALIKIRVLIPVFIFVLIFICSESVIKDLDVLRNISYSIIVALVVALLLAILTGKTVFEYNGLGGKLYIGFNGGILYKNYFSATVLASFIGIYLYFKFSKQYKRDIIALIILISVIFMASSNGTFIMMFVFLISINFHHIYQLTKRQKWLLFIIGSVIGLCIGAELYAEIALNNQNYLYRIIGLKNYLNVFGKDKFHMFFGNAELAFASEDTYVNNVRAVTGWDGTLELSWLGILIKNGVLGIITYVIVFFKVFISAIQEKDIVKKRILYSLLITTLASSLVETYIQNVHVIFGIYAFTLMHGYKGCKDEEEQAKRYRHIKFNEEDVKYARINKCNTECL